jgi:hypothetical protein
MTNPRLVPIPKRDARGRFVSQPPPAHLPAISSPTRAVPPLAWPLKSHDVAANVSDGPMREHRGSWVTHASK